MQLDLSQPVHGSCVAVAGHAALIIGPSGSGKSTLALTLMGFGAQLVADDRTWLNRKGRAIVARAPDSISGLIEARGVGILKADPVANVPLRCVIDMGHLNEIRLPATQQIDICGIAIPLLHRTNTLGFAPAVMQYLRGGTQEQGLD